MKKIVLILTIIFVFKAVVFANDENFSLGYWKIDVDKYMVEYDKKLKVRAYDKKRKNMMKMFRTMTLKALKNSVIEIKNDSVVFYQVKKDNVIKGKQTKLNNEMVEFKPEVDSKSKGITSIKKLSNELIEFKNNKRDFCLIKMTSEGAKIKIAEIKSLKKEPVKKE